MQIAKRLPYYASLVFLAYMPFHLFLTQWLSLYTGGLDVWKVAKDILLAIITLFVICSVMVAGRATRLFRWLTALTALYAAFHVLLWLLHPDIYRNSAYIGFVYNLRLPCFTILGLGASLLWPEAIRRRTLIKVILAVSTIVAFLGVLQYFLPKDILTHFGYSIDRGARAAFYIDDKAGFPRIMSTLREPNSLASYLLVPTTLAALLWFKSRVAKQKLLLSGVISLHILAIFLTFSRSAWTGVLLALGLAVAWQYHAKLVNFARRYWIVGAVVLLVGAGMAYAQRNTPFVQGYISHTSNDGDLSSNDYHWIFVKQGIEGIVSQPLGHGPGTAGLASIQNPKGSFLTENYYVQIGYEVGILGLLVFISLNILLYRALWRQRSELLPVVLLATFWAYFLINMLLHIWSNEAVACQWWLLAGLVIGMQSQAQIKPRKTA